MEAAGRLDDGHAALVALAKSLAASLDEAPGNAALAREYRAVVATLTEVGAGDDVDDDTAEFRRAVQAPVPAAVGNGAHTD
ncbi:MAG: hypothetical protein M3404_01915 [Actinomycetota bacterium]|nr:hypothetical protein [Actinomycetota bacterium]